MFANSKSGLKIPAFLRRYKLFAVFLVAFAACQVFAAQPRQSAAPALSSVSNEMELSRPVRPWEFLCATGTRAGLFGHESGQIEAWVYPLKLFRDFHLRFHFAGRTVPAEALVRTIVARPESTTLVYGDDTFTVRETFFVPVNEQGAIISLQVQTEQPLEVQASFVRDFQLEWPAALGGTYSYWDPKLQAFYLGEETKKFVGLIGSPRAVESNEEYQTNYSQSRSNSFTLGVVNKGQDHRIIVLAASLNGPAEATEIYTRLAASYNQLLQDSADYYRQYLNQTVAVELPDAQLQRAYDWARVSIVQGKVTNPYLGTGLVAGYRTSGDSQRPGFAWFFGRDAFWTSLALDAEGDFADARTALQFVAKYQRADGKIPHEIAQGASFVPWFTNYPYAYASADATPLYIIAAADYVQRSGDVVFTKEQWDSLWKAYQFLLSTYDEQGLPKNFGIGHGWVEGGPLLPVKTELYQSGLGAEALRALSELARVAGKNDLSDQLAQDFARQKPKVDEAFWMAKEKRYAFAIDQTGKPVDQASVLSTVPMWFGLINETNANEMITQLAGEDSQSDWGMRIISDRSAKFSGGGYHYGSVWPLFTGWASVGEYRYHRALPAYENLRANALLTLDGSLGHVAEVLSGDYYQPLSTSSPHQIWSSAMVVSPLLLGMFGLSADANSSTLTFAPHVPADWAKFRIAKIQVGKNILTLSYAKSESGISLDVQRTSGSGDCIVEFRPALSPRAKVLRVERNGRPLAFDVDANEDDQHVSLRFPVTNAANNIRIHDVNDFGLTVDSSLPPLGSVSRGLRVLSQTWSAAKDQMRLELSGAAGLPYELKVWDAAEIAKVDGADLAGKPGEQSVIVRIPASDTETYPHATVVFHFVDGDKKSSSKARLDRNHPSK